MLISELQKIFYSLKKRILTVFGDIKTFRFPCWLIYDARGFLLKGEDFDRVSQKTKKYDVVLNRFENYLDVGFIPGWWNHAGVVTGHNADVNPEITHALSEGIVTETLVDFMRSDHIVVLRPRFKIDAELFKTRLEQARKKEYDFNFDFSDGDKLSCTELISFLYEGMFPGFKKDTIFLGREALLPDGIANSEYFETVLEIKNVLS